MGISIGEIMQDAELVKQMLPEIEAWWASSQALISKFEAIKAARTNAAGGPPTGAV